jgi:hypothetical protein
MYMTTSDIEAEHDAAIGSLSVAQRRAFERLALAESRSWRDGGDIEVHLERVFACEAVARSVIVANDR